MRQTENLGLNLPEGPDPYNEKDYNDNFEIIDDKLKYLADHIGGGGTYGTLTAYNNDIYEASQDPEIDAWDKVVVDVPPTTPNEILDSEWDLLNCNSTNGYLNEVKAVKLGTDRYRDFANGYLTANGGGVTLNRYDTGDIIRCIIKMGLFDRNLEPSQQYLGLFQFIYDSQGCVLYYDNNNDRWLVRDAGGSTEYVPGDYLPKYALENATIEVVYGAKYIDGQLYRGIRGVENYKSSTTMYIHATNNQEYIIEYTGQTSEGFMCHIGSGGSAWMGALFENAKIYKVLNCYDKFYEPPTSLINSAPEETEEQRTEIIEETEEPEDSEER